MQYESQLLPILREGVDIIKMIFFRKLRDHLARKHTECDQAHINKLSGAIINELFGSLNPQPSFVLFAEENRSVIETEMKNVATEFDKMRIPLTDAMRVQFLCDHKEGVDSSAVLKKARELGILILEREIPLPAKFMSLVRKLGSAHNIIAVESDGPRHTLM